MKQTIQADVVIIGGGITGCVSAYMLSQVGKKVVLVEKETIDSGATKYTTAFITQAIDTDYSDFVETLGFEKAKLIAESHGVAISILEEIITEEHIECGFIRCSNYTYANSKKEFETLEEEYEILKKLGMSVGLKQKGNSLGFKNFGYLEFKNQAKFSASEFLKKLTPILKKQKVTILENTDVTDVRSDTDHVTVQTGDRSIKGEWVIIATYEPFNKPLSLYFRKAFYTTYVMKAEIAKGIIPEAIYEDTEDPYHYFRIDSGKKKDSIMIGGEDHRSDVHVKPEKNFKALEEYLQNILPGMKYAIKSKWQGPILEPVDGLPFIGPLDKKNVLYAMAFSGNGMTYSTIAARMFVDIISNRRNDWYDIYRADRMLSLKSLMKKGRDYTREFIHGAVKNTFTK